MATTVTLWSLVNPIRYRIGDIESGSQVYTDDQIFIHIEQTGAKAYNSEMIQEVAVAGTSRQKYFTPAMNEDGRYLMILFSSRSILEGEKMRSSRSAISFSNPVSNVDLTDVAAQLDKDITRITNEIRDIKKKIKLASVVSQIGIQSLSRSITSGVELDTE